MGAGSGFNVRFLDSKKICPARLYDACTLTKGKQLIPLRMPHLHEFPVNFVQQSHCAYTF